MLTATLWNAADVPRRNRKGRRPGQRPRRFHSTRESRRERRELVALDEQPESALPKQCGNCIEWLSPRAETLGSRGTCIHPASGILAPDPETPACAWFRVRKQTI